MIRIDSTTLTNLINTCFTLSGNLDLSPDHQKAFLVAGKRLRGSLVNLLSATFEHGTQAVDDANQKMKQINEQASQITGNLAKTGDVLNQVNGVVGVLDELLKFAKSFV
jgi:hypothetical protein